MTHTYNVTGMTCSGCQAKVQSLLSKVTGVSKVSIDLSTGDTTIDMDKHISTPVLKEALNEYPKYQLSEKIIQPPTPAVSQPVEESKSWLQTYKPILLIFGYITAISLLTEWVQGGFIWMRWMNHFMAGFFFFFSFFKLLNLKGFAESYSMAGAMYMHLQNWHWVSPFLQALTLSLPIWLPLW